MKFLPRTTEIRASARDCQAWVAEVLGKSGWGLVGDGANRLRFRWPGSDRFVTVGLTETAFYRFDAQRGPVDYCRFPTRDREAIWKHILEKT